MKKFALFVVLLLFFAQTYSQKSYYLVSFTDKQSSEYRISAPEQFLSNRSIERRLAQNIAFNETDLPVSPNYLKTVSESGFDIVLTLKWFNAAIVTTNSGKQPEVLQNFSFVKKVEAIEGKPETNSTKPFFEAEKDFTPYNFQKSTDNLNYGESYNQINMLNGTELHNNGFQGQGMTIAVLDAGFYRVDDLEAFDSLWNNNQILGTRDIVLPGNDVCGSWNHTHGMKVLSCIGGYLDGELIGTAPKANFYLIRTEDADAEYLMEEYFWAAGAEYADSLGVDIINSSLGYTTFDNPAENHQYTDLDGNTTVITIAADLAASKGILVVNSAGNSGADEWHYIGAPADADSILTVGAVDSWGDYASFSSVGPTADGRVKPEVVAQGESAIVASTEGGITYASGTSFSSPITAGMAACIWGANRGYSNMEIYQAIIQSSSIYNSPTDELGYGIPNYWQAHLSLREHAANFIEFSFVDVQSLVEYNLDLQTISVTVPQGTDLTNLTAEFIISEGAEIEIAGAPQISGESVNNFSSPVTYTITAADGTTTNDWFVTVSEQTGIFTLLPQNLNVYPNPANQRVFVELTEGALLEVFDVNGRIVWKETANSKTLNINVSDWYPATYIFRVSINNEAITKNVVIVKE